MKITTNSFSVKRMFIGFLALITFFSFTSCARKISFITSSVVPAARGTLIIKHDKNSNYVIKIEISDLAEVSRLSPPRQTYVIWMMNDLQQPINIGKLNSSTSMFSKKLTASFETVSSTKPIKIFITAEDDVNTQNPSMQLILTTDRF